MNIDKSLIFLCISVCILIFSLITIFTAPFINKINDDRTQFSKWRNLNCKYYSDQKKEAISLDDLQNFEKTKNLCYRQKAAYNLEFASFVINLILGLISSQLGLLLYFKINNKIEKITGIFGLVSGTICFILTFVYICFSGYIFTNDTAYKVLKPGFENGGSPIEKLFPNRGIWKWIDNSNYITAFQGDNNDESIYIKYNELGQKQYNYNNQDYLARQHGLTNCPKSSPPVRPNYNGIPCEYSYNDYNPLVEASISNKYLYDNWVTTIIFACFIIICDIGQSIFGFLLFKTKKESDEDIPDIPNTEPVQSNNKE